MDVRLNEDQLMFQDMTRRFLEDRAPLGATRKLAGAGRSFDPDAWREGAEQGWVALFVPESRGGMAESAQGVIDAAIVAEELGRVIHAGPFVSSCVVADAIAREGTDAQKDAWLAGLAAGETRAAWCYAGSAVDGGIEAGGVRAERDGDAIILSGTARHAVDAELADVLLVSALGDTGLAQFLVPADAPGVTVTPLEMLDLGRRAADVAFDAVRVDASAQFGGAAEEAFERQAQVALALICAETVGVIDRAFEFTLEWVNQRYAFNRPIGSFQALKHRLADHAAQFEGARAAAAHAARAVQEDAADAAVAVSVAKSHCGRWAVEIIRDFVQMHGGIGVTWEHDIHFFLRRACSNEMLFGTPAAHHERLCRLAGL